MATIRILLVDDHAIVAKVIYRCWQNSPTYKWLPKRQMAFRLISVLRNAGPMWWLPIFLCPESADLNSFPASNNAMRTRRCWCSACIKIQALLCRPAARVPWVTSPKAVRRKCCCVRSARFIGRHTLSADIAQLLALEKLGNERMALETLTVREFEILRLLVEARTERILRKSSTSARKPSATAIT